MLFIELPKFKAHSFTDKKLQVLWLRFISELDEKMTLVPAEWLAVPEIETAVQLAAEAAYSPTELEYCDQYWDSVRIQRSYVADAEVKGEAKGRIEGIKETLAAITLIQQGEKDETILHKTGLSVEVLKELRQKIN